MDTSNYSMDQNVLTIKPEIIEDTEVSRDIQDVEPSTSTGISGRRGKYVNYTEVPDFDEVESDGSFHHVGDGAYSISGKQNQMNSSAQDLYACTAGMACNKYFNNIRKFKHHMLQHGISVRICKACKMVFNTAIEYTSHLYKAHPTVPWEFCDVEGCNKVFINKHLLKQHIGTHVIKSFYCEGCKVSYKNAGSLSCHRKKEMAQGLLVCRVQNCFAKFTMGCMLTQHKAKVHNIGLMCPVCGRVYTSPSYYEVHLLSHNLDEEEITEFDESLDYGMHIDAPNHQSEFNSTSNFTCAGCKVSLKSAATLNAHLTKNLSKANVSCDQATCNKQFSMQCELTLHKAIVHSIGSMCPFCYRVYSSVQYFKTHLKLHEGQEPAPRLPNMFRLVTQESGPSGIKEEAPGITSGMKAANPEEHVPIKKEIPDMQYDHERTAPNEGYYENQQSNGLSLLDDKPSIKQEPIEVLSDDSYEVHQAYSERVPEQDSIENCKRKLIENLSKQNPALTSQFCKQNPVSTPQFCKVCEKMFPNYVEFKDHLKIHGFKDPTTPTVKKVTKYPCPAKGCRKVCLSQSNLNRHVAIHSQEKRCKHCNMEFRDGKSMRHHMRKEEEFGPYPCEEDNCGKVFAFGCVFTQHRAFAHGVSHLCQTCGKVYLVQQAFNLHMQRHKEKAQFSFDGMLWSPIPCAGDNPDDEKNGNDGDGNDDVRANDDGNVNIGGGNDVGNANVDAVGANNHEDSWEVEEEFVMIPSNSASNDNHGLKSNRAPNAQTLDEQSSLKMTNESSNSSKENHPQQGNDGPDCSLILGVDSCSEDEEYEDDDVDSAAHIISSDDEDEGKNFACPMCQGRFSTMELLESHIEDNNCRSSWGCTIPRCQEVVQSKQLLRQHLISKHNAGNTQTCPYDGCFAEFWYPGDLGKHIMYQHINKGHEPPEMKPLKEQPVNQSPTIYPSSDNHQLKRSPVNDPADTVVAANSSFHQPAKKSKVVIFS